MSRIDKSLSKVFGVDPMHAEDEPQESSFALVTPEDRAIAAFNDADATDLDKDAALVRSNLHAIITEGQAAFEKLIMIAKEEEKVSAFEVANNMLANLTNINMTLLKVHEQKRKMKMADKAKSATEGSPGQIVNNGGTTNIAFVGSSKDLMKHLKDSNVLEQAMKELPSEEDLDSDEDSAPKKE